MEQARYMGSDFKERNNNKTDGSSKGLCKSIWHDNWCYETPAVEYET